MWSRISKPGSSHPLEVPKHSNNMKNASAWRAHATVTCSAPAHIPDLSAARFFRLFSPFRLVPRHPPHAHSLPARELSKHKQGSAARDVRSHFLPVLHKICSAYSRWRVPADGPCLHIMCCSFQHQQWIFSHACVTEMSVLGDGTQTLPQRQRNKFRNTFGLEHSVTCSTALARRRKAQGRSSIANLNHSDLQKPGTSSSVLRGPLACALCL